ncbi:MAG: globin [Verrucomicrobiota bacterium]
MDETLITGHLDEAAMRRLAAAFYRRMREDDLIGPMYPQDDWEGAEERFAGFLCFRFYGNMGYIASRGHPRLRGRHLPFRIGEAERDRWLEIMCAAMLETAVPAEAAGALTAFFAQVADFMRNTGPGPE